MPDTAAGPAATVPPGLVPAPASLQVAEGCVVVPDGARLAAAPQLAPAARAWRRTAEAAFGIDIATVEAGAPDADVVVVLDAALPPGGYRLRVGAGQGPLVEAACADLAGAHAAAQTLRQLAGPAAFRYAPAPAAVLRLPACEVTDAPRLEWRGVLLDVARHFLPKADVLRFVDLAAAHHLDVLQLHLTDDQGWRLAVDAYPRLTEVGSWRGESTVGTWRTGRGDGRPHGGCYSRADVREIVAYARERGVTVVPEIDVPGHVQAVLAAYPELAARAGARAVRTTWGISDDVLDPSPRAVEFFARVLDQVCEDFDAPFVALGGDEVPTTAWRERPDVVARAAGLGLVGPDGAGDVARLHGWFLARLAEHLRSRGRRAVVWDEAFGPDLPRDVVVTAWRGTAVARAARAAGHDVVLAPEQHVYLDHRQGHGADEPVPVGFLRTLEDVYAFEPVAEPDGVTGVAVRGARADGAPVDGAPARGVAPGRLLGAQAQVWTEHLDSARRIDYAAFPRLAAFAEVAWTRGLPADRAPGSRASRAFVERLRTAHLPRLDAAGVEYRPLAGPHPWQTRPGVQGHLRDLAAEVAVAGDVGLGGWVEGRAGAE
ncbi:beta-N-acetylhexosaminidase [Puerhibacterium puerhi]|uniref:beta-N-acetylhexosaminidase n=1 Tax=Puerhibacterium puerhi TaxID=2692623 RepID=UPI001F39061B|nr:beta-N-acetylhexosaminidase [Puerhibacterium puerhi]